MKKLKLIILSAWVLINTNIIVLAQSTTPATSEAPTLPTFTWDKMDQFIGYINNSFTNLLADFLLPTAGGIIVIMIIWGGFKYIQGDPETGKKTITAAIIGLVIIVLSTLIITTVNNVITGNF